MKAAKIFLLLSYFIVMQSAAANFLYDIIDGKFRAKTVGELRSMTDGEHFSQMIGDFAVMKYNYFTGKSVDTLFSISQAKNCPIKSIAGYEISPNEQKMLVYTNVKQRYRRSFTADYYVYDLRRREIIPLSEYGSQEVPLFSPDSRYIAFARNNNLYMKKLDFNTEIAITKDGEQEKIINGTPDWVYEEEFEATRHFVWSPDSKLLAYTRFDETNVPEFSFQQFINRSADEPQLYPNIVTFKYPKAGEANSKVRVCVYDDFNKTTKTVQLPAGEDDFYIPRIMFSHSPEQLVVFKLNRNQNRLEMLMANPRSTLTKLIFHEDDKCYVDYSNIKGVCFTADNRQFILTSEKDGYRHIYLYNINGTQAQQITKGAWDVTGFYGYCETKKTVYYQSAEKSPMQRDVYSIDLKGNKKLLTDGKGTHQAVFNSTYTLFTDKASALSQPDRITLRNAAGKILRPVADNSELKTAFDALKLPAKEFFSFTTSENITLNGWMIKPRNFNPDKKYPVVMLQYSGPDSQQALDVWEIGWEYYLTENGYAVACVDGRGTGARGAAFRKSTCEQLGVLEARDQIETAKYLGNQSFIDRNRIGIWGWSYGGSTVLWAMCSGEKVFKAGIAVAPVTDWRLYNTAYTERFMNRPQENFTGYARTSTLIQAEKLNGHLLLVHGTADDNVHYQNTLQFIDKLITAGKQFDMQIYPDKNHSMLGVQTRRHLYTKMSEFLFANL